MHDHPAACHLATTDTPAAHLAALLDGTAGEATHAWLAAGFRRWLVQGGRSGVDAAGRPVRMRAGLGLCAALGLPGTPERARGTMRDHYLAQLLDWLRDVEGWGSDAWPLARELHRRAVYFERRHWPAWWHLPGPPAHAGEDDALLWRARHASGLPLPGTPERYLQLVREALSVR
jgi:hypothetical protein